MKHYLDLPEPRSCFPYKKRKKEKGYVNGI